MAIRFSTFPRTQPPPDFISRVVEVFTTRNDRIGSSESRERLTSNQTLEVLREDLTALGFNVEANKPNKNKNVRPVLFGENAKPDLQFEIDAWHPEWKAGLEIEAARARMGNAIHRDLIHALVDFEIDHLILAVKNAYYYGASEKQVKSRDYRYTVSIAEALYSQSRISMPYSLCVIGY